MGMLNGKCDNCIGGRQYHAWELRQAGGRTLCNLHYGQYKQQQEWEERERKQRKQQQGPTQQSTSEPTGEDGFWLVAIIFAAAAVGVGVLVYQSISTSDTSPKSAHPWPHPVTPTTHRPRPSTDPYKIILNGLDIAAQGPGVRVTCDPQDYLRGGDATGISVGNVQPTSNGGASALVTNADPPQLVAVDLHTYGNKHWSWYREQPGTQQGAKPGSPGNAAVTKRGKIYKITGSIAPCTRLASTDCGPSGSPVPFEFDATCP